MPKPQAKPLKKPPLRQISLGEYEQVVNGETYHPHAGEAIFLRPSDPVGDVLELGKLAGFKARVEAIEGDPDAEVQAVGILAELVESFAAYLAPRVVRWTVTDQADAPLPQPDGDVERIKALETSALMWVFGRLQVGETPARRGEG